MHAVPGHFRHAIRLLARTPVFTATAILTLAIGIAAGSAIFRARTAAVVNPGPRGAGIDVVTMNLDAAGYTQADQPRIADELRRTLGALPGVHAVGIARLIPPQGAATGVETTGMPLLRGRAFSPDDEYEVLDGAIVNEQFAAALWPGREAVGQIVEMVDLRPGRETSRRALRIVGIVRESRSEWIGQIPGPFIYVPSARHSTSELTEVCRSC